MENKLKILLTGATGGIGIGICKRLAEINCELILLYRNENDEFTNLLNILKKKKIQTHKYKCDFLVDNDLNSVLNDIKIKHDKIDVLINNSASILVLPFLMTSIKKAKDIFQINYFSVLKITQEISKKMIKAKSGNIINICSTSGIENDEGRIAYSNSKAALISFGCSLSKELKNFNIRVNNIAPGLVNTKMLHDNTNIKILDEVKKKISLNRFAEPDEIAKIVLFLISDQSSYINGQTLRIDGGM